eukprot:TRINITY_DN671_c0_g1_i1.p1 TRINITY_DN671_c0_g1~~TRINITY_DN671_c0_g1_i1.p1  ORF type:complete len:383 (+),score=87.81 TRINITY_DN671_c0_g1_i1:278-1426(+)
MEQNLLAIGDNEDKFMREVVKAVPTAEYSDVFMYGNISVVHLTATEEVIWEDGALDRTMTLAAFHIGAHYLGLAYVKVGSEMQYNSSIVSRTVSFLELRFEVCMNSSLPASVEYPTAAWYYEILALHANISDVFDIRIHSICEGARCVPADTLTDALVFGNGAATAPDTSRAGTTRIVLTIGIAGTTVFNEQHFRHNCNKAWGSTSFGCATEVVVPPAPSDSVVVGLVVGACVGALCCMVALIMLLWKKRIKAKKKMKKKKKRSQSRSAAQSSIGGTEPYNSTHTHPEMETPAYDPYMPVAGTVADKHSWEVVSNDGRPYYYNRATGLSRWDTPTVLDPNYVSTTSTQCNSNFGTDEENAMSEHTPASPLPSPSTPPVVQST